MTETLTSTSLTYSFRRSRDLDRIWGKWAVTRWYEAPGRLNVLIHQSIFVKPTMAEKPSVVKGVILYVFGSMLAL